MPSATMSYVKAGRLRALAVTSSKPTDLAPGLPTIASAGFVGYESVSVYGWLAPSRTPASIVGRLNQETLRVVNVAEIKERFFNVDVETRRQLAGGTRGQHQGRYHPLEQS